MGLHVDDNAHGLRSISRTGATTVSRPSAISPRRPGPGANLRTDSVSDPRRSAHMTPPSAVETAQPGAQTTVVNDFTIVVATVNGTGSQTSNNTLIRAIMGMGVPVAGRNIFPSNNFGLPTWYAIRVCQDGWSARQRRANIVIAMNLATAHDDVAKASPGSAVISDQ